jgi:hypothetical protein
MDYHVYPTNGNLYNNKVFIIDSLAKAHGKKIIIGEAWAYKESDSEYFGSSNFLNSVTVNQARNCFDYWQGVDTLFIKSLFHLARQAKIQMVNLFWSQYMFGQVPYSAATYGSLSYPQQTALANSTIDQNMHNGLIGPIGSYTKAAITYYCGSTHTGITESPQAEMSLYPNPTAGSFYVALPTGTGPVQLSMTDMTGRIVYTTTAESTTQPILVSPGAGSGLYILHVSSAGGDSYARVVVY